MGLNPYGYQWKITNQASELQDKYSGLENGEEVDVEVSIAGRIIARRVFGKLAFFNLQDESGTIQLYLDKKRITTQMPDAENPFSTLTKLSDVGDILGVVGAIKKTEKGELSE